MKKTDSFFSTYSSIFYLFIFLLVWTVLVILSNKVAFKNELTAFFPNTNSLSAQYLTHRLSTEQSQTWLMIAVQKNVKNIMNYSQSIQHRLQQINGVKQVLNGSESFESPFQTKSLPNIYAYRYIFTDFKLSNDFIYTQVHQRWEEYQLGLVPDKTWMFDDPSYQWVEYLKSWQSSQKIIKQNGIWVSSSHLLFLIELETDVLLMDKINKTLSKQVGKSNYLISGADWVAFQAEEEIKQAVNWVTSLAISIIFISLLIVFRSLNLLLLSSLPLVVALTVGILSTLSFFGSMQLITLALGAILLGVAIDYPIHTISAFQSRNNNVINKIWPTIRLGALTSAFGFLMLWWVDIEGIQQIAVFASTGLVGAFLTTKSLKPILTKTFKIIEEKNDSNQQLIKPINYSKPWFILTLPLLLIITLILSFKPIQWQDDIVSLSPVSSSLIETDRKLRSFFKQKEVGKKILIKANNIEQLLLTEELLSNQLDNLQQEGSIQDYQMLSQLLPSQALQKKRQQNLPNNIQLTEYIIKATKNNAFKRENFSSFLTSVEVSKSLPVLNYDMFLQYNVSSLQVIKQYTVPIDNHIIGVINLSGVASDLLIQQFVKQNEELELTYFNQRELVANQIGEIRNQLFNVLFIFIMVLLISLILKFRNIKDVSIILMPVLLSIGLTLSIFSLLEISLSIFHLMSLMLITAIGLDYSLLFAQSTKQVKHSREWHYSIRVAFITTIASFAILAFSPLELLQAIGLTVLIGVLSVYVLSYLTARLSVINFR